MRHKRFPGEEVARFDWAIGNWVAMLAVAVFAIFMAQTPKTVTDINRGVIIIEMHWDSAVNADVDLWVEGPGVNPVGYSHKQGAIMDLVRDDMGKQTDPLSDNSELVIGRSAPAGEYVVNAVLYHSHDGKLPVTGSALAMVFVDGASYTLWRKSFTLKANGDEVTVARFTLDEDKRLVRGSVNDLLKVLWGGMSKVPG